MSRGSKALFRKKRAKKMKKPAKIAFLEKKPAKKDEKVF
jgi:hypothetical protein